MNNNKIASLPKLRYKPIPLLVSLLIFAFVFHSGALIKGALYADDFIHAALFKQTPSIKSLGFLPESKNSESLLLNQFNFFNPLSSNYDELIEYGVLPWWIDSNAQLHFFRPLASVTHYIDYQLFPDNPRLMHLHNLIWYILGLLAILWCFKQFKLPQKVITLSFILIILDLSMFHVVNWVASRSMLMVITLSFCSLVCYDKSQFDVRWLLPGFILFCLALLSAEGGLAVCFLLAAYVLFFDERKWLVRFITIAPFAITAMSWRWFYQEQGFGPNGLDFYIDPAQEPDAFLARALWLFPASIAELSLGYDVLAGQLNHHLRKILGIVGFGFFCLLIFQIRAALIAHKSLRFFLFSAILLVIPALGLVLSPRALVIPFICFSVVLSYWFIHYFEHWKKITQLPIASILLVMHIVLPTTFGILINYQAIQSNNKTLIDNNIDIKSKKLIFINAEKPFWLVFLAHTKAYQNQPIPKSSRMIASGFYPMTILRKSSNQLIINAYPGFQFSSDPIKKEPFIGHYAYQSQYLMGLIGKKKQWQVGEHIHYSDLSIRVTEVTNHRASELSIEWEKEAAFLWLFWNQQTQQYEQLFLPKIGTCIALPGLFLANSFKRAAKNCSKLGT